MHWFVMYGLGVATAAIVKTAGPSIAVFARPILRQTIKGSLVIGRELQRTTEETLSTLEDITAEARAELEAAEQLVAPPTRHNGRATRPPADAADPRVAVTVSSPN